MNKNSISESSCTDWERIHAMQDEDIDISEIPEITEEQIARAVLRVGGQPIPQGKVLVPLLLDADVIEFFKAQAGEEQYHILINEMLKITIQHHEVEPLARQVFRKKTDSLH